MSSHRQKLQQTIVCIVATLVVCACIGIWSAAAAEPARAVVDRLDSALLTTMKQGDALGFEGRYARLAPEVDDVFDLRTMARRAQGRRWQSLDAHERRDRLARYRHGVIAAYAQGFDDHHGQRFDVTRVKNLDGARREVSTAIVASNGERRPIRYILANRGGDWRIVDMHSPEGRGPAALRGVARKA